MDTHIKIVLNPVTNLVRKATCQADSAVEGCFAQQTHPRLGSWRIKKSALRAEPGVQPAGADGPDTSGKAVPKLREDRSDHNYQIKWEEAFCVCSNSHDFLVSQGTNVTLAEECGC